MEIQVNLYQEEALRASALFTMVAREKADPSKAYPLPALNLVEEPDMPKAELRRDRGQKNREIRMEELKQAFDKSLPEKEEIAQLMMMLGKNMQFGKPQKIKEHANYVKPSVFKMRQTTASKSLLMHIQDRNIQGKIFGGFLMR